MDSAPPEQKRLDYREEAHSIRAVANHTKNADVREQLLLIASLYDKLAGICEQAGQPLPQLAVDCRTGSSDAV
jgi:hypothetical protein